jgi:hypothetical protein
MTKWLVAITNAVLCIYSAAAASASDAKDVMPSFLINPPSEDRWIYVNFDPEIGNIFVVKGSIVKQSDSRKAGVVIESLATMTSVVGGKSAIALIEYDCTDKTMRQHSSRIFEDRGLKGRELSSTVQIARWSPVTQSKLQQSVLAYVCSI